MVSFATRVWRINDFNAFLHNFNPLICINWVFIFRHDFISGTTHRSYRFFYEISLLINIMKIIIWFIRAVITVI